MNATIMRDYHNINEALFSYSHSDSSWKSFSHWYSFFMIFSVIDGHFELDWGERAVNWNFHFTFEFYASDNLRIQIFIKKYKLWLCMHHATLIVRGGGIRSKFQHQIRIHHFQKPHLQNFDPQLWKFELLPPRIGFHSTVRPFPSKKTWSPEVVFCHLLGK